MERLKAMKEQLTSCVQSQIGNLSEVNAQELGEAVDMIKDLSEAIYYCSITKAMEENEKQYKSGNSYYTRPIYYDDKEYGYPYYDKERMYYGGNKGNMNIGTDGSRRYYIPEFYREREMPRENLMRDPREGRSPLSRRMYMESKEMHQDTAKKMQELEKYVQELSADITEMIAEATPEEKQLLKQKIATLSNKIA